MENMERKKFEQAWHNALAGAEQTPSDKVWMEVDKGLAVAEGGVMKRKVVFYQRLAAASILFALSLGAVTSYYWVNERDSSNQLVENTPLIDQMHKDELRADQKSSDNTSEGNVGYEISEKPPLDKGSEPIDGGTTPLITLVSDEEPKDTESGNPVHSAHEVYCHAFDYEYTSLKSIDRLQVEVQGKPRLVTLVRKLPAMPSYMMAESKRDRKTENGENFWAAVGAAAGNYNPQVASSQSMSMALSNSGNSSRGGSDMNSKGNAYSMGFQVGTKVAERWVVQGGVAYMNQSIGYTSTVMANRSNHLFAAVADYNNKGTSNITQSITNPYDINSVSEYITLPVQAGYRVVNRKAGVQINSGLATDIFLRNTLTDKSGQLDTYSEGAGENSPYRTVSWSALLSTELSYRLGSQYRLALVPGMRYSLNPVTKSGDIINPFVWDLGFRFKYIFK